MKSFAESYLTRLIERRLLLEDSQIYEVNRGLTMALNEGDSIPLERLAGAVERMTSDSGTAIVNLLNMPLGPLWVSAALRSARERIGGQRQPCIVIIGLWAILKGPMGRRTEATEKRFCEWRDFVENQLANVGNAIVLWIG